MAAGWGSSDTDAVPGIAVLEAPDIRKVLVVDDHRTVADALASAIRDVMQVEQVVTARSVKEALAICERFEPQVVMDVHLGDGDGLNATSLLTQRFPDVRVVVLTGYPTPAVLQRAVAAGACALLPKDGSLDDLMRTMHEARRDDFVVHPSHLRWTRRNDNAKPPPPSMTALTRREEEVLQRLGEA